MGVEGFTILAILEANDRISRVLEQVDGSLDKFSSAAARAAETAAVAGERIDASLLQTASGADATELASAKLSAAQSKVATTAKAQADAERAVIEAQTQVTAAEDGDTAATERLVAANDALTAAQKRAALAAKEEAAAADHAAAVGRAQTAAAGDTAAATDAAAASTARAGQSAERAAVGGTMLSKGMGLAAVGIAAVGVLSVKAAGNFESMTEHLVTDAGESQKNIGMIRSGMLALATTTGTTTDQMAAGMYHVESAGFHGQKALDVLKVAAEGAKVGGADLDTIGQALTGTMNAFGPSAGNATQMMNAMIATVGAGDMKMEAFGSSLGNVAAIGASAGLSFAQVAGGVATMTAQNVSAQRATQDLAHTIGSLGNPTAVQSKEMMAMGVDSLSLSKNLGKNGLTGTFDILVKAIAAHTKGGAVMVNTLNASKAAALQANAVLLQMPPTMKKMAEGWQAGTTSTKDFNTAIHALPPAQQKMYMAFEQMTKKSGAFAQSLQANTPMAQTFNAALARMTGGTTSLNTILMLSGAHAQTFKDNVKTIGDAAHKTGDSVDNWDKIQGTFNQKLDTAKASVEAIGISIGTALLPVVSKIASEVLKVVTPLAEWAEKHQKLMGYIAIGVTSLLALAGAIKLVSIVMGILNLIMDANVFVLIGLAVVGLVAGFIYLWDHVKGFRDFWIDCWDVIKGVFGVVKTIVMTYIHLLVDEFKLLAAAGMILWHALETAWNAIAGAAKAVWSWLVGIWNDVYSSTMAVWNAISGFFMKWWPLLLVIFLPFIAILMALWNHFHQDIWDALVTAWNAVSGFLVGAWKEIEMWAKTAWNLIKQYIVTPIEDAWKAIQPPIKAVEKFLSMVWNGIKAAALFIWAGIKAGIINPIIDAWHVIVDTFNKVKTTISTQLNAAWNFVKGIGSKFLSIGSSIVEGIIKGIEGAGGALLNTIENMANNALGGALSFLGINSPSKVFADRVGMAIPEGVAKGVNDHAHLAHRAVTALSAGLADAGALAMNSGLSVSGSAAIGALPYGGSGPGGGVTYVTFDLRGSSVMSNGDMDLLVGKIGNALTKKILPQGGVRIRA